MQENTSLNHTNSHYNDTGDNEMNEMTETNENTKLANLIQNSEINEINFASLEKNISLALEQDRAFYRLAQYYKTCPFVPVSIRNAPAIQFVIRIALQNSLEYCELLQNIYLIKDKMCFSSHYLWGLATSNPDCISYEVKSSMEEATAVIKKRMRNGEIINFESRFTMENAKEAGLLESGIGWKKFPQQMLEARTKCFCVRNAFPNFLKGVYTKEEVESF